jgi:hypothetical protein
MQSQWLDNPKPLLSSRLHSQFGMLRIMRWLSSVGGGGGGGGGMQ